MRILHIITHFSISSGAARLVSSLIPYQIKQGNQVDVLALYELPPTYVHEIEKCGCNYNFLWNKEKNKFNPKTIFKLIPIIKKYDIVHTHLFPSLYWVVIAKKLSHAKCKLVVTEHSTFNNRQGKWYFKYIEKYIYHQYNAIIAISQAVKDCIHRFVDEKLHVNVINNGIVLQNFYDAKQITRNSVGIPDDVYLIVQTAGFRHEKDQLTLMRAIKRLSGNFHVAFIGTGSTLEFHKQKAIELGIQNRVYFLGLRQDVPEILKIADLVVMSSHQEGFGLAAVEAMAVGKPVIATAIPGLQEVVEGAGILFPLHDDEYLSKEILHVCNDKSFTSEIKTKCLERAQKYDIKSMAEKYNSVYKTIMRG